MTSTVPPHLEDAGVEKELNVIQNLSITLDCPVTGTPEPSVMWLKDRQPLLDFPYPNLRTLANGKRLEVSRAQVSDGGRYSCMATNVAGQIETSYKLTVQGKSCVKISRKSCFMFRNLYLRCLRTELKGSSTTDCTGSYRYKVWVVELTYLL